MIFKTVYLKRHLKDVIAKLMKHILTKKWKILLIIILDLLKLCGVAMKNVS